MDKLMGDNEKLKLVRDQSDVPEDYELLEIENIMKLSKSNYGELRSLIRKAIKDGTIKLTRKVEDDKKKDIGEECINFTSTGDVGVHRQYQMGSYIKTSQRIQGCPVFELAHEQKDKRNYFLFVGPDGRWRIGPDVTSYSGSVLKHPQQNAKMPPRNGWLYYLDNKWKDAKSLHVTLNVKDWKDKEEVLKFSSKGDARDHRKNEMGSYIKTSQIMRGSPIFEQVNKEGDEKQHYLFVGPDGCWRVGPDVKSYSGSVLKHPEKYAKKPPKTGWLYYLNNKWNEDDTLKFITEEKVVGVPESKAPIQKKISRSCDCIIVDKFELHSTSHSYITDFKNVTCLGIAILRGDTAAVETSLEKGCDINFDKTTMHYYQKQNYYQFGLTPLMLACHWSSLPVISLLVGQKGIEIDKRNDDGETALIMVARKPENLDIVKLLVESGAKLYLRDSEGYNALHRAVQAGAEDVVKYLHSKGANLYVHGTGSTLIWSAVDEENLPMVRFLFENGASLDSPHNGYNGCSPFQMAVFNLSVQIVKYMIEQGADVTAKPNENTYGETTLEIAHCGMDRKHPGCGTDENWQKYGEDKQKYEEIICMLKAAKAESKNDRAVKTCDCSMVEVFQVSENVSFYNLSCLGIGVLQNDIKAVETSLRRGCNVNFDKTYCNYEWDGGWTPLMLACDQSSCPIVSMLVRQPGIQIDKAWETNIRTAMFCALKRDQNLDMVKILVEAGADPDMRNISGQSLLNQAADEGQLDTLKYFESKGACINTKCSIGNPLWRAAYHGNLDIVKYLANQGADLDSPSGLHEYFPLNAAVAKGNVDVVKFLIEQGADVDKETDVDEDTKIRWSNLEIAREKMDDPETEEKDKPLYESIIGILKEAGAEDGGVIKNLVLDTLDAIMWIWAEKIKKLPYCIQKLQVLTYKHEAWQDILQALVEVVSVQNPIGPIAMCLLIKHISKYHDPYPSSYAMRDYPYRVKKDYIRDLIPEMLKILEIASSYDANDIRHGNVSAILSSFAGYIQTKLYRDDIWGLNEHILFPAMVDYLFGNLKPGSKPEAAIFSLLALEFLANEKENKENAERVRKRFREYGPDDHPLLRMEKLVVSDDFVEKQAGFLAQWYLDNLWPLDNPDARNQKIIDNTNVNVRLVASEEWNKYLKVGSNGLEVRGDGLWFETAMSTGQVYNGSWYYEVTIITGGFMQIGWATSNSRFLTGGGYGVGDDKFSQSYEGCRQIVWYDLLPADGDKPHGGALEGQGPISSWKPGDVIGSLIDIENEEIVFSLNGVNIRSEPYKDVFKKVKNKYFFAAISLMSFQQCQVNFGKDPFKHPPEERIWKPLDATNTVQRNF